MIVNNSIKSVAWSALERFSVQVFQFLTSIILARLVYPSEYGLIAMLTIFISIAQSFVDSGFSSALIQKNNRTEIDYSTVFYFNIIVSLFVYIFLFLSAPYIAIYFREPKLEIICKWMGLGVIIQGLSVVHVAKLTIMLDFKTQAKASLSAVIISGFFGVYLAYNGYGVWSLLFQYLFNNLLNTGFLWVFTKWVPSFKFSILSLKSLFSFGSKLLLSGLLHTLYVNLYSLVIGRKYTSMHVGFFNQSSLIARFPSVSLMAIISRAIYPIQCEVQDKDELLRTSFIQYLRMSCYIICPIMIGMAVLAKPLVLLLLTEKWLPMSDYLSVLCFAYMWIPLLVMNNQILLVKGRTDYFLKAEVIKKISGISILIISIPFGIKIICIGFLFYNLFEIFIIIFYSRKVTSISYFEQFKIILPFYLLSIFMGIFVFLTISVFHNIFMQIIFGSLIGVLVYFTLSKLFNIKEFIFLLNKSKDIKLLL